MGNPYPNKRLLPVLMPDCDCGRPSVRRKNSSYVCERCDRLEQEGFAGGPETRAFDGNDIELRAGGYTEYRLAAQGSTCSRFSRVD